MKKLCLVAVLSLVGFGQAKAGLFLDPYLGYAIGEFSLESSLGTNESDTDSVVAGLRLGYAKAGFFVGPDLMFHVPGDFEPSLSDPNLPASSTVSRNGDSSQGQVFLTAGYKIPVLPFRVYAGYAIYSNYQLEFSGGEDVEFEGNGGYKLGVGYKPGLAVIRLPFSINLEYMVNKFDEANGIGALGGDKADFPFITGTGSNIATYNDADIETIMLSVSVPLTFFN